MAAHPQLQDRQQPEPATPRITTAYLMKISRVIVFGGLTFATLCATNTAQAQDRPKPSQAADYDQVAMSLLFVQSARGLAYDASKGTLALQGIGPVVTFFTDRPYRIAGHVSLPGFLAAWNEGSDSFEADPPNADLSILQQGKVQSAVIELSNPRVIASRLTYNVKVLDGELPASGGACSLFIDNLFRGAARGAAGGAIIGAACGDAGKGAAIGAAVGGVAGEARSRRMRAFEMGRHSQSATVVSSPTPATSTPSPATPNPAPQSPTAQTPKAQGTPFSVTMNVPNSTGGVTPVKLTEVANGWQGLKGEIYPQFPSVDELKKIYGQ